MSAFDPKRTFATLDFTLGLLRHEALAWFPTFGQARVNFGAARETARAVRVAPICALR